MKTFQTVDIERVDANDPESAIKTFVMDRRPRIVECDVFIAGGGMGGIAAAIRAAQSRVSVCVSEETEWIGGQMTAQGVSAFDENKYVETSGATRMYQRLRQKIRDHYRALPGTPQDEHLNPGKCWVSWCAFEPKVGLKKLYELIAEECEGLKRKPKIFTRTKVVQIKLHRGRVKSALAVNLDTGRFIEFRTRFCVDATELGDLLPMIGVPYASGAESREETGEPHAPLEANADNVQDFTYPFVVTNDKAMASRIEKPAQYDEFKKADKFNFRAGERVFPMYDDPKHDMPFWTYRRLVAKELFPSYKFDVSMINWESNDVRGENLIDVPLDVQAQRLALGKLISLGFLYWLQTDAGHPEISLLRDQLGTPDGMSKYPYIRESRRIKARKRIVEQEIAAATNGGARAKLFKDSVGIGLYPIDIHGHQDVPGVGQASKPFQIPLRAMVQTHIRNFIPACKNIGTTHVTNGAYRLHPIEWAIGEAAGFVAAMCVKQRSTPDAVARNQRKLRTIQRALVDAGSPIFWFDDVATSDPDFAQLQMAAVTGELIFDDAHLSGRKAKKACTSNL
jgi:hypothetical protein